MSILIFIGILVVLIVGHEFGHLLVAKASGMKVPEFGIGFPPKLWGKKIGDTEYTVNALPFGGFVKIVGEDDADLDDPRAFGKRPRILQALTLLAGPGMNLVLGLVFATLAFMIGVPAVVDGGDNAQFIQHPEVLLVEVLAGSPAEKAGIKVGDRIISITSGTKKVEVTKPEDIPDAIQDSKGEVVFSVLRAGSTIDFKVVPVVGLDTAHKERAVVGVAPALVGTLTLPVEKALVQGVTGTISNTIDIFKGLMSLIGRAFTLTADVSQVTGPVGIVSLVGDAAHFGFGSILSLAALISLNLAIVNLLPFPALDGGRMAFLFAETVTRRRIPAQVANALNIGGFMLLIGLMLAVTAHDIFKLLG